jgi:tripartite-type tricarboxylate transporter receptor subunit TctC
MLLAKPHWTFRFLFLAGLAGATNASLAQEYPSKPITLLVGFAAGSATDSVARLAGQHLNPKLKVPILVDNKPGAGTILSVQTLLKSPKDGYTLKLGTSGTLVQSPGVVKDLPYDVVRDFVPIVGVARVGGVLVVRNSLPVSNIKDLIAYLKKNPGKVTYGSAGIGAAGHLNGEYFMFRTGTEMIHVPYKGANQVSLDIVAERLDLALTNGAPAWPLIRSGKMRALAVTTLKRIPSAGNVPTLSEAGFPGAEGLDPYTFYGIVGPAGLPPSPIARINQAVNEILQDQDFVKKLANMEFEADTPNTPADFARFLANQLAVWKELGARLNITMN